MKIKRILSIFLIFALSFGMCTIAFAEENIGIPEDDVGFMPTLPPCEEVDVSVVYRPITSMVSFANFGPFLDGMVLKVTYADGTSEYITLEKDESDYWDYVAGDYYVYFGFLETTEVKSPGINHKRIAIDGFKGDMNYAGIYEDFSYLYIPSLGEWMFMFSYIFKSIFNPIIDFGV